MPGRSEAKPRSFIYWVLSLREYQDRDGEGRLTAKPVSTFADPVPAVPDDLTARGVEQANLIHGLDRRVGYPFAWFFGIAFKPGAELPDGPQTD